MYPENDYRNYLIHWGKGGESKSHKYISRKMGSAGKWIYTYAKNALGGKQQQKRDLTLKITDDANRTADRLRDESNAADGLNGTFEKASSARTIANATAANYHKALDEYMRTPLGQLERASNAISKGRKKLSKALGAIKDSPLASTVKKTRNKLSNTWDRSSLSSTGRKRRENANDVWQNMRIEDEKRVWGSIRDISDAIRSGDDKAFDKAIARRNTAYKSQDATNKKHNKKSKKYLDYHSKKYYQGKEAAERGR